MKTLPLILFFFLWVPSTRADVKFIHFEKLDPSGRYKTQAAFLRDNLVYYDHWSPSWTYAIPKESLIRQLKECLAVFERLQTDPHETGLLLGEIAHYLYNLDQQDYYDTAEHFYHQAIQAEAADYRGYWFLGYHYALSNEPVKAVVAFGQAEGIVPGDAPGDFWMEYAYAMMIAGLPSHCRYGVNKAIMKGNDALLLHFIDSTSRATLVEASADSTYTARDIWWSQRSGDNGRVDFVGRPLGVRMDVGGDWHMGFNGFQNGMSAVTMQPPALTSTKGKTIGFSMVLVVHIPKEGETIDQFVRMMTRGNGQADTLPGFLKRYPGAIAFALDDKTIYPDRGGAHIRYYGFERDAPAVPGLQLENGGRKMNTPAGKLTYVTVGRTRSRFPGKLYYFLLLDTCEDIYADSWQEFSEWAAHHLTIE